MYYNKDALDALGLKPATTWDELWTQASYLKTKYPTATPLGYDSEANWFITMCEQNGWGYTSADAPHYLFNNDNTKTWLNKLNEYYNKGYIATQTSTVPTPPHCSQRALKAAQSTASVHPAAHLTKIRVAHSNGASHPSPEAFKQTAP